MSENRDSISQKPRWPVSRIIKVVCLTMLVALVVGGIAQVAFAPPSHNTLGLRGQLKVEAEPGFDVFIGNTNVGRGNVDVSWDDLLGTVRQQPLAVQLGTEVPSPGTDGMRQIIAEQLVGSDSEIVWTRGGYTGQSLSPEPISFAWTKVLVRRGDGQLDLLSVFDGEFYNQTTSWRRFLIPIRVRSTSNADENFFDSPLGEIGGDSVGPLPTSLIGDQLLITLRELRSSPPEQFADEIADTGLWRPSSE